MDLSSGVVSTKRGEVEILSDVDTIKGAETCVAQAAVLLRDADALLSQQSFDTAAGLASVALEEVGKAFLLSSALRIKKDDRRAWRAFWRAFRSHEAKRYCAGLVASGFMDAAQLEGTATLVNIGQMDTIRRFAFYTDWIDGQWTHGLFTAPDAQTFVHHALSIWNSFANHMNSGSLSKLVALNSGDRFNQETWNFLIETGERLYDRNDQPLSPEVLKQRLRGRPIRRFQFFRPSK